MPGKRIHLLFLLQKYFRHRFWIVMLWLVRSFTCFNIIGPQKKMVAIFATLRNFYREKGPAAIIIAANGCLNLTT